MVTRSFVAVVGFVAALAAAPFTAANALEIYTIEGYLDRAPNQAEIIGRVKVSASKTRTRYLLVTALRSSTVDPDLARATLLRDESEEFSRLLGAPTGTAVKLTFAVYEQGVSSLLIVELGDNGA